MAHRIPWSDRRSSNTRHAPEAVRDTSRAILSGMTRRRLSLSLFLSAVAALTMISCTRGAETTTIAGAPNGDGGGSGTAPGSAMPPPARTPADADQTAARSTDTSASTTASITRTTSSLRSPHPSLRPSTTTVRSARPNTLVEFRVQIEAGKTDQSAADVEVTLTPMITRSVERLEKKDERGVVVAGRAEDDCKAALAHVSETGWDCSISRTIVADPSRQIVVRTDDSGMATFLDPSSRRVTIDTEKITTNGRCYLSGSAELTLWTEETPRVVMKEECPAPDAPAP
jgi:hypothetical protein